MRYGTPRYDGSGYGIRANYGRGRVPGINGRDQIFGLSQAEPVTEPVEPAQAGVSTWALVIIAAGIGGYVIGQLVESAKWKKYSGRDGGTTPTTRPY